LFGGNKKLQSMGQSAESLLDGEKKKKKWKMEPEVDCKTAVHLFSI
jgi:hypothetical protein